MSHDARKPIFGVSDQVRHRSTCTVLETGEKRKISDLRRREILVYLCSENKGADQLHSY